MSVPKLSHLQSMVLWFVSRGEVSGKQIRRGIRCNRVEMSGPSFYQLMGRMENSGFVEGEYRQKIVEGQIIRERFYRITTEGMGEFLATRNFYGAMKLEAA